MPTVSDKQKQNYKDIDTPYYGRLAFVGVVFLIVLYFVLFICMLYAKNSLDKECRAKFTNEWHAVYKSHDRAKICAKGSERAEIIK